MGVQSPQHLQGKLGWCQGLVLKLSSGDERSPDLTASQQVSWLQKHQVQRETMSQKLRQQQKRVPVVGIWPPQCGPHLRTSLLHTCCACLSSIANAPLYGERDGNGSGYVWLDSCQQLFTGRHQPSVIKVHRGRKLGLEAVLCLATECIVRLSLFGAHTDLDLTEVCLPQPPDFAAEGQGCSTLLRRRSQSKVTTALSLSLFFAQALTVAHPDLEGNSPASAPYTLGL